MTQRKRADDDPPSAKQILARQIANLEKVSEDHRTEIDELTRTVGRLERAVAAQKVELDGLRAAGPTGQPSGRGGLNCDSLTPVRKPKASNKEIEDKLMQNKIYRDIVASLATAAAASCDAGDDDMFAAKFAEQAT
jgi:anti-sigma-K factor RskA